LKCGDISPLWICNALQEIQSDAKTTASRRKSQTCIRTHTEIRKAPTDKSRMGLSLADYALLHLRHLIGIEQRDVKELAC
jgi:hypothetical protein